MRIFCAVVLMCSLAVAETKLGQPLALKKVTAIDKLLASPEKFIGKKVQVKGKVSDVCQMMGCWMNLVDDASGKIIKIKVNDGEIVFPKDSKGKMATAEGIFAKLELSKEQAISMAKHEAEANKRAFDPSAITGPQTIYQIKGSGAVILD